MHFSEQVFVRGKEVGEKFLYLSLTSPRANIKKEFFLKLGKNHKNRIKLLNYAVNLTNVTKIARNYPNVSNEQGNPDLTSLPPSIKYLKIREKLRGGGDIGQFVETVPKVL